MLKCILKGGGRGDGVLNLTILTVYAAFTHVFHISAETSLDSYRFRKDRQL